MRSTTKHHRHHQNQSHQYDIMIISVVEHTHVPHQSIIKGSKHRHSARTDHPLEINHEIKYNVNSDYRKNIIEYNDSDTVIVNSTPQVS